MKKLISLLLVFVMLLALCACGSTEAPAPETTEPTEPFVTNTIIKDGASQYTIVYDGTTGAKDLAAKVKNTIRTNFGVELPVEVTDGEEGADYEIIVGNARPLAEKAAAKTRGELDFAVQVEEKALILYAPDNVSYEYFIQYLTSNLFQPTENGELTMDSGDNLVYSQGIPVDMNYIEYMRSNGKSCNWLDLFAFKEYKNADTTLPYRIYIPFNYSPDKKLPVLLNLHGAGLRGNDNTKHMGYLNTMLLDESQEMSDTIIICPQCPENQKWVDTDWTKGSYSTDNVPESNELKAVVELVQQVMQQYPVDENRIYVCGFSMGGYGTWDLLARHADLFCAGVPMCGAGDPSKAEQMKNTPIWAIHGAKDPTVPVKGSQDMAQALESVGAADARYTELPDNEHDVWNYTYTNTEIFTWLFSQKKS